jgi:hypothetical protein
MPIAGVFIAYLAINNIAKWFENKKWGDESTIVTPCLTRLKLSECLPTALG